MFNGMGGGGFMLMGLFFLLVIIAAIFWVVYMVMNQTKVRSQISVINETPLEILKKRYAKGEIAKEQFEEMKEKLND